MTPILFDGWTGLFRVVIVGTCGYVALLLILRVSGKRTRQAERVRLRRHHRARLDLSTVLLSKDVALAEGVTAMGLLALLEFVVAGGSRAAAGGAPSSSLSRRSCTGTGFSPERCGPAG